MTDKDDFATSYDERQEASIEELKEQTEEALKIAFNNIEYMLGNAEVADNETFSKLEDLHEAIQKSWEFVCSGTFQNKVSDQDGEA